MAIAVQAHNWSLAILLVRSNTTITSNDLVQAVRNGQDGLVADIFNRGILPETADDDDMTAIEAAMSHGYGSTIERSIVLHLGRPICGA